MSGLLGRPQLGVVERMASTDLDAVVEIERVSHPAPWAPQVFIEELAREWAHLDVLRPGPGESILGFVNFWLVHDEVHLLNVAVHPDARRRGAASRLIEHTIDFAWRAGCRYVTLEVRRSNLGAIRLYQNFGFRQVGIRRDYYVQNREDAIVMLLEQGGKSDGGSGDRGGV